MHVLGVVHSLGNKLHRVAAGDKDSDIQDRWQFLRQGHQGNGSFLRNDERKELQYFYRSRWWVI